MRVPCDPFFPHPDTLRLTERAAKTGSLLVFPTETVYGVGCIYTDIGGLQKIFTLKQRPRNMPLALMFPTVDRAIDFLGVSGWVADVVRALLPNPVTIVAPHADSVVLNSYVEGTDGFVGIRVADHPLVISICALFRAPLAVTSANLHGAPDPVSFDEISIPMDDDVLALDAGETVLKKPSTVVRLDPEQRRISVVRHGALQAEKILQEATALGPEVTGPRQA